jgi:hypothetical protein
VPGLRPEDDKVSPLKDENHGVQDYLSVIESPAMGSKQTELIKSMLRLEMRPHVLKVFSETAMWRGQGKQGYFHGAPEDWNFVAAALRKTAREAFKTRLCKILISTTCRA